VKKCKYCRKSFPESDFGVAKTTQNKVYRRCKCRYCYRKTKNDLKEKRRGWLADYKAEKGCKSCGLSDHRVLDFHHNGDKEFTISDFYYHQFSLKKLELEVAKCEILCANCHRIYHFEERVNKKEAKTKKRY
jgi:hypothetical protein